MDSGISQRTSSLGRSRPRGFSLIEIMVVIAIVGMMMGGVVVSVRSIGKTELRAAASKLAGAIRYCFDRAITTGAYFRLVLDLDGNKYWVERSNERAYLTRGKEKALGAGKARDVNAEERQADDDDAKYEEELSRKSGGAVALDPPPKPKRAKFQTFVDATLPQIVLKRITIEDVYTVRQPEAYTSGRAYLYFFPDGHTERAFIRLADGGDDWYSLIVHPLTGRVEVMAGKQDLPRNFEVDAEGKTVAPR